MGCCNCCKSGEALVGDGDDADPAEEGGFARIAAKVISCVESAHGEVWTTFPPT